MKLDFLTTWAVVPARKSVLHNYPVSQHALLCSALSIKKWYPEARTRFLVDQDTYNLLEEKNWLDLWDSVEIIDFPAENPGFKQYYAYPKLYTYRFIENPTIILDAETVVSRRLELDNSTRVLGPRWNYMWNEDDRAERDLQDWFSSRPDWKRDFYPTKHNSYVGAWSLYVPSKEVGVYVSEKTCKHIDYCLGTFSMRYGGGPACYLEDGYISHCFEEICGIDFSKSDEWSQTFLHFGWDKWESDMSKDTVDLRNEYLTGVKGVYDKYFRKKAKSIV